MQVPRGLEDFGVSLLAYQSTDRAHDDVGRPMRSELASSRERVSGGDRCGVETAEVDPVSEQRQLLLGHAETLQHAQVLGILHELRVRACRRETFQAVDECPLRRRVTRERIQAVYRVDGDGDAGNAR